MGRLVDTNDVYNVLTDYYHHKTATQHMVLEDALSTAKTVDAIPIDWLMQKADEWKGEGRYAHNFGARLLTALINDWKRSKNET